MPCGVASQNTQSMPPCLPKSRVVSQLLGPGAVVLLDDLGKTVVGQRAALEAYRVPPVAAILREVMKGSRENRKRSGIRGELASQTEGPASPSAMTQGCLPERRTGGTVCQASFG